MTVVLVLGVFVLFGKFLGAAARSLRESASSVIDGHIEICEALHDLIARGQE
jgi:hypothetical protein